MALPSFQSAFPPFAATVCCSGVEEDSGGDAASAAACAFWPSSPGAQPQTPPAPGSSHWPTSSLIGPGGDMLGPRSEPDSDFEYDLASEYSSSGSVSSATFASSQHGSGEAK